MAVSLGHGRCFSFFRFLLLLLKTRIMNNMPLSQPGPALMAPNMSAASRGMGSGEGRPLTLDIYVCALKAALKEEEEGEKKKKKAQQIALPVKAPCSIGAGQPPLGTAPSGRCEPGPCGFVAVDFLLSGRICKARPMLAAQLPSRCRLGRRGLWRGAEHQQRDEPGAGDVDGQEMRLDGEGN